MRHLIFLLSLIICQFSFALSKSEQGEIIANNVYNRPMGKTRFFTIKMQITEGSDISIRELNLYEYEKKKGEEYSLIRFTAPAKITDLGLLTLDHINKESDQWVYLPALKKSRRISSSQKDGNFAGSDLTYEDMERRSPSRDNHLFMGVEKYLNEDCNVIESTPKKSSDSIYQKRKIWVHTKYHLPLKIEYYKKLSNTAHKTTFVNGYKNIEGIWTMTDYTVTDHKDKRNTRMTLGNIKYNIPLDETIFNQKYLEDPSRLKNLKF